MALSPTAFFSRPPLVFAAAVLLRLGLLIYGRWQDTNSPIKYTDIDYLVFTDAASFVARGRSPYDRATYRYTPLLAWLLYPTSWRNGSVPWFEFGKAVFAIGDIVTGWLIARILRTKQGVTTQASMKYASIWLLNPMVANISTRGSSEGLVVVFVIALLSAILDHKYSLAGLLLGFGVHFKIYPFIYAASAWCWLGPGIADVLRDEGDLVYKLKSFFTSGRIALAREACISFSVLNAIMFYFYGMPFIENSYLYHFIRTDHRHNFSVYNTLLHLDSAHGNASSLKVESLAFLPQLALAVVLIPLVLAKNDLASTMFAQTLAFVTFNKVCTSQYFLWYLVFLPFYLPTSTLMKDVKSGIAALMLWILGQALWLQQGFELEFLGKPTFVPGLCLASVVFFGVNCWILGIIVDDIRDKRNDGSSIQKKSR